MDKNGKRQESWVLDTGINTVPVQYFRTKGRAFSSIFSWPLKKKGLLLFLLDDWLTFASQFVCKWICVCLFLQIAKCLLCAVYTNVTLQHNKLQEIVESQHHVKDFEPENIPAHIFCFFIGCFHMDAVCQSYFYLGFYKLWRTRATKSTAYGRWDTSKRLKEETRQRQSILCIIVEKLQEKLEWALIIDPKGIHYNNLTQRTIRCWD